jgi:hypothetical protein
MIFDPLDVIGQIFIDLPDILTSKNPRIALGCLLSSIGIILVIVLLVNWLHGGG